MHRITTLAFALLLVAPAHCLSQFGGSQPGREPDLRETMNRMLMVIEELQGRIVELENRIEELQATVEELTAATEESVSDQKRREDAVDDEDDSASAPDRVMQLLRFEAAPADLESTAEAKALRGEAKKCEEEAEKCKVKREELQNIDENYWRYRDRDDYRREANEKRRQREELSRRISDWTSKARQFNARAKRLEDQAAIPRQIIHGWNGSANIELHTETDCSRKLSELAVGDFLAWHGRQMTQDASKEVWSVRAIRSVPKPHNFSSAPAQNR